MCQIVRLLELFSFAFILLLALLHLVTCLLFQRLLQNLVKNLFRVRRHTLLLDVFFDLLLAFRFDARLLLTLLDALVTLKFHLQDLLVDLLLLGLLIVFIVHAIHTVWGVADQLGAVELCHFRSDLALLVVVKNRDFSLGSLQVEFALFNLLGGRFLRVVIQFKFLGHLLDGNIFAIVALIL